MKGMIEVQSSTAGNQDYSIPVKCPYCGKITVVNKRMTESGCNHFDDFEELFSMDSSDDKVEAIGSTFRAAGSRRPRVVKHVSCEIIDTEEGWKLMVDGKFDSFLSNEEMLNSWSVDGSDDEDDDDNEEVI